ARYLVRMVECDRQRDRPAQRVPDEQGPLQAEFVDEAGDEGRVLLRTRGDQPHARRIARARPVERNEPEIALKRGKQRQKMKLRAAEAVDEQDRPALPPVDMVDAVAVDGGEPAGRR